LYIFLSDYVSYYLRCEVGRVENPFKDVSIVLQWRFCCDEIYKTLNNTNTTHFCRAMYCHFRDGELWCRWLSVLGNL